MSENASWYYEVVAPGYKYNMTDITAGLGIQQLKKAPGFYKRRNEIASQYHEGFKNIEEITTPYIARPEDKHAYHLAHVFKYVRSGATRIGAASDNPDKRPVAFVNKDSTWAVVVRAKEAGGPLTFVGLPAGRYGLRFTGEDRKIEHWPPRLVETGLPLKVELPGPGVITVYGKKSD